MKKSTCILFEKKKILVFLFGRKLFLAESNVKDFIDYVQFIIENNQNKETDFLLFQSAHVLHCALKYNLEIIPWYRFIKKFVLKFLISEENIMRMLGQTQMESYVQLVLKLEGLHVEPDEKKKLNNIGKEYLGSEQGYALLMNKFNWTVKEINNLPISKYFMFTNEAFNISNLDNGGKYKYASTEDRKMYKTMVAFKEIQQMKKEGRWH